MPDLDILDTTVIDERTETDADGVHAVIEQANGVVVRMLVDPSPEYVAAQEAAAPPPPADAAGLKVAVLGYLGITAAVTPPLSGFITLAIDSLNASNWTLARQIIGAAAQAKALTAEQYSNILGLMDEYHIPTETAP